MHESERDGAAVRVPPPLVYLGAVFAGALLHAFVSPVPLLLPLGARIAVTAAAILLGLSAIAGAIRLFRRSGQDPKPW